MPTTFCFVTQSACASHGVGFAHYAFMGHGSAGGPARDFSRDYFWDV